MLFVLSDLARDQKASEGFAQFASRWWRRSSEHKEGFVEALKLEVISRASLTCHFHGENIKYSSEGKNRFSIEKLFSFFLLLLLSVLKR